LCAYIDNFLTNQLVKEVKIGPYMAKLLLNIENYPKVHGQTIAARPEYATDTQQTLCVITEHYGTDTMRCPHYCIV